LIHYHSYYKGFTEEQFAADEYFQQWVLSPDSSSNDFWQSWLNLYAGETATILKARELVKELASDTYHIQPLSAEEKASIKTSIYQRLDLNENSEGPSSNRKYYWLLSAAAFFAIAVISSFILFKPGDKISEAQPLFTIIRSDKETREITLPDSSVVILNAGSSLKYNNNFFDQPDREVFLEGNAFFKVTKQADKRHFVVHAKSLDITVLGTQFNVNARSAATDVGLTSGKVKVTLPGNDGEAYMLPGEKLKLDTAQKQLIKTKLDTKLYSAWTEHKWNFQQTKLEDVAGLINEYYGITTEFKNEKHRKLKITAVIPVTNMEMLARILSKTLHIDIESINDRLIIQ
jgi:ferric-dicitrate binding protein FerR (iron transport regulator)